MINDSQLRAEISALLFSHGITSFFFFGIEDLGNGSVYCPCFSQAERDSFFGSIPAEIQTLVRGYMESRAGFEGIIEFPRETRFIKKPNQGGRNNG